MMGFKANRPAYSVLGHSRDDAIELPPWQQSLRRYLADRELVR
jgi:dTDP-4-dehydrorhamnose reductase